MKNRLLLLTLFFISTMSFAQNKKKQPAMDQEKVGKIIYVYDALCGWCYGFSPVMEKLHQNYSETIDFEVISGGMVTGSRIGEIGKVAPYISWAYKDVEKATGVKFGTDFLDKTLKTGTAIFTSIPPAIAMSVFKSIKPENAVAYAASLQKAVYFDGIEPLNEAHYGILAEKFGIDKAIFSTKMKEENYKKAAETDFELSNKLGVNGFPTVFFEDKAGKRTVIARGYVAYKDLEQSLKKVIK